MRVLTKAGAALLLIISTTETSCFSPTLSYRAWPKAVRKIPSATKHVKPPSLSLSADSVSSGTSDDITDLAGFDERQMDFTIGYFNKHHRSLLKTFTAAFTELGTKKSKRNAFSGGSYKIDDARIVSLDATSVTLDVTVRERSKPDPSVERVTMGLGEFRLPPFTPFCAKAFWKIFMCVKKIRRRIQMHREMNIIIPVTRI